MTLPFRRPDAERPQESPSLPASGLPTASAGSDRTRDDIALMQRLAARDQAALAELYDRHARLLYGLVLRVVRSRSEAEEVLQDAFVAIWNRADSYKAELGTPIGWLVRIARNRAVDRLRANAVRLRAVESWLPEEPPIETPEGAVAFGEQQRAVMGALAALPCEQRDLIEQAYFLGLTHSELAERQRLPLGTVKSRVRAGLLALRQQLAHLDGQL